jgi:hypothetical protein
VVSVPEFRAVESGSVSTRTAHETAGLDHRGRFEPSRHTGECVPRCSSTSDAYSGSTGSRALRCWPTGGRSVVTVIGRRRP